MLLLPTKLYHTIAPAVRAAVLSFLTAGTDATQRGRAPQFIFIMSKMRRAVVGPSSVTALTSIGGGAFTEDQSSRISAANPCKENRRIPKPATAAALRIKFRIPAIVPPSELVSRAVTCAEFSYPLSAASYASHPLETTNLWDSHSWLSLKVL